MPDFIPDIKRLSAMPFAESLTMLVYGGSGTGKTGFIGSAGPRNVIINTGHGLTTLQSPWFRDKYKFDPWVINIPDNVDQFDAVCQSIDWLIANKRDDFDVISIDDCSALKRMARQKAIEINSDLQKTDTLAKSKKHGGIIAPQIADYGEEISVMEWFFSSYTEIAKQYNFHLLCVAHERITFGKPPRIGEPAPIRKIAPGFTGQTFPDAVPAFFDEVWRFEVVGRGEKKQFRATTIGNEITIAKSRHGGIFDEVEKNIDFPTVLQKIKKFNYVPDPKNPELLMAVK